MDPLTHAASGAIALLAFPSRPHTRWAVILAALATASPDVDVFFGTGPLNSLLMHRGITHALAAAPLIGLLLAFLLYPLWRKTIEERWNFGQVWLFSIFLLLLHIWLDCTTTYGTLIFLPFSELRVRFNSNFIVDPFILFPALAIWLWTITRKLPTPEIPTSMMKEEASPLQRRLARPAKICLAWIFCYPLVCLGIQQWHYWRLPDTIRTPQAYVLPEILAPFNWRVLYHDASQDHIVASGLSWDNQLTGTRLSRPAADPLLMQELNLSDTTCQAFFRFSLLPVQETFIWENGLEYHFYDLRFGSNLTLLRDLRQANEPPFQLWVRLNKTGHLVSVRLIFSAGLKDSGWHPPNPPLVPSLLHWLVGRP